MEHHAWTIDRLQNYLAVLEDDPAALREYLDKICPQITKNNPHFVLAVPRSRICKPSTIREVFRRGINCTNYLQVCVIKNGDISLMEEFLRKPWTNLEMWQMDWESDFLRLVPNRLWDRVTEMTTQARRPYEVKDWKRIQQELITREQINRPKILCLMAGISGPPDTHFWCVKTDTSPTGRFWKIAQQLPFDVQTRLAGMLLGGKPSRPFYDLDTLTGLLKI